MRRRRWVALLILILLLTTGVVFWARPVGVFRVFNEAQMYWIGARNHQTTVSGFRIHHDGSLTSVVNPAQFTLPFTTIGLAAE